MIKKNKKKIQRVSLPNNPPLIAPWKAAFPCMQGDSGSQQHQSHTAWRLPLSITLLEMVRCQHRYVTTKPESVMKKWGWWKRKLYWICKLLVRMGGKDSFSCPFFLSFLYLFLHFYFFYSLLFLPSLWGFFLLFFFSCWILCTVIVHSLYEHLYPFCCPMKIWQRRSTSITSRYRRSQQ